jgi:hypothetical protein
MVVLAENQREIADAIGAKGAALLLNPVNLVASLAGQLAVVTTPDVLRPMSKRAAVLVDGCGSDRIITALGSMSQEDSR